MSRIIAIKLTDDWEKNEHIEANIKKTLEIWGGEIVTDAIKHCFASQMVSREHYSYSLMSEEFKQYIKKNIATEIGKYALENNLITYNEIPLNHAINITGRLNILDLSKPEEEPKYVYKNWSER